MNFPFTLATERQFDAVGFGLNAVDHLIVVPEYPGFDTKVRLLEHRQASGGQAATTMVALQRLGLRTAYAGRFGSDAEGQFGLQSIKSEGVDLEFAEVIAGARNQVAFIIVDARNGERTIIWDRDERVSYTADEAPVALASRGRVLHLDAHDPPAGARMAHAARAAGTIVTADVDNIYEGLRELLPLIDVLVGAKEFPRRLTGIADERASLIELKARYGCGIVGMTKGASGASVYCEGQFIDSPAYEVPGGCRDTTGAGDAFHGGFLLGLLRGEDVETSLRFANAVAALKCRDLGARTTLPSENELSEFLRNVNCAGSPAGRPGWGA
ncbi:MAG TPA: PfkB family carbohydrate kinase [Pyrinomonadaceae bacterium]|jgi:sugar/nucleoside kinase (ribokinase family)|nr:PfkB family carbohydrate kinase [Pyrinomonadaceae bacterium]